MLTMSPLTRYLSRLLGVFLLVMAVSHWTQPEFLTVVSPGMFDQPGLLWVFRMLTFAAGLAVVLAPSAKVRHGSRLWENVCEPSKRRTVFSIGFFR